jgi:hypothetical protein
MSCYRREVREVDIVLLRYISLCLRPHPSGVTLPPVSALGGVHMRLLFTCLIVGVDHRCRRHDVSHVAGLEASYLGFFTLACRAGRVHPLLVGVMLTSLLTNTSASALLSWGRVLQLRTSHTSAPMLLEKQDGHPCVHVEPIMWLPWYVVTWRVPSLTGLHHMEI